MLIRSVVFSTRLSSVVCKFSSTATSATGSAAAASTGSTIRIADGTTVSNDIDATTGSTATTNTSTNTNFSPYGRLWGRGYEELLDRQIIRIHGDGASKYLQNLITSNILSELPPTPPRPEEMDNGDHTHKRTDHQTVPVVKFNGKLRTTCFLDPRGRIITDALLWKLNENEYYIDAPDHVVTDDDNSNSSNNNSKESVLMQHLNQYKLRRTKVTIEHYTKNNSAKVSSHVLFGTLDSGMDTCPPGYISGLDPRHPSLGVRILQLPDAINNGLPSLSELLSKQFDSSSSSSSSSDSDIDNNNTNNNAMRGNYNLLRRLAGIAEGQELTGRIALETNQELLNAVSFDKGCYLGQELTARVFHTGVVRKRIMPLVLLEPQSIIPQPWIVASQLQERRSQKQFTAKELATLPSRLPRLSVAAAGQLVAITTASIEPTNPSIDTDAAHELHTAQVKVTKWLQDEVEVACQPTNETDGAKIIDSETGTTIGQIVAPPVKGTNLVLALMRLESVGLIKGETWSKTNKVTINGKQFRYLPYLPLWWPELSMNTGKAKREDDDYSDEARMEEEVIPNDDTNNDSSSESKSTIPPGMARIAIEEIKNDEDVTTTTSSPPNVTSDTK